MNFISFSLNGASKSRILETQIKDIIYVLKSSKSKGFINPDKKIYPENPYKKIFIWVLEKHF